MENNTPKILIAEDETALRDLYKMRLELEGFKVISACDGKEALLKIKNEKPDLVLLDIMMPEMSGMEVLDEVKADASVANIPIIILSVLFNEDVKRQALEKGADYLIKGQVQPKKVADVIKEKLGI